VSEALTICRYCGAGLRIGGTNSRDTDMLCISYS
jgi:hypothetical protein